MKRILITGSKGFIGSHLVREIRDIGEVREWDKQILKDIFDPVFEKQVKWVNVVIHLAALTNVNQSFKKIEDVFYTNVLGTAKVVELCQKYNKKLIYPSSAAIYHRELSPYAESKALAEDIVSKFKNTTILRFFNVYGPGMNQDSGSLMYEFVKGLKTSKLIVFGDGEQTRDFIHIKDIVDIIKRSLSSNWTGKIVDCGTGEAYSINYIAGLFSYYGKVKIEYQLPRREIKWSIANTAMLKTLGKRKFVDIEDGIKEVVKYYETN